MELFRECILFYFIVFYLGRARRLGIRGFYAHIAHHSEFLHVSASFFVTKYRLSDVRMRQRPLVYTLDNI